MKNKYHTLKIIPAGIFNGLIWFMSSQSVSVNTVSHGDKMLHIAEYFILGFLLAFGLGINEKNYKKKLILVITLGLTISLIDEFHQYFVPMRQFDVLDIFADFIGINLGLFIWIILVKFQKSFLPKKTNV